MSGRIAGFAVRLPESWHAVPAGTEGLEEWARATAAALVDEAGPAPAPDVTAEDLAGVLALQLVDVGRAVADTGLVGLETAVLVRHPERGVVDAMITVTAQHDQTAEAFAAELAAVVEGSQDHDFAYAGRFDGTTGVGPVTGMHALITHFGEIGEEGSAVLEERVVLGVFPAGCDDMIELTAISRSVGTFDDMPQEMLDLLAGLELEMEAG